MTQTKGLWGFFDGDIAAAEAIRALRRTDTRFTLYAPVRREYARRKDHKDVFALAQSFCIMRQVRWHF